jgi:hypothetical protein
MVRSIMSKSDKFHKLAIRSNRGVVSRYKSLWLETKRERATNSREQLLKARQGQVLLWSIRSSSQIGIVGRW